MSHLQHINSSISDNPEPPKKKDVKKENSVDVLIAIKKNPF